MVSAVKELMLEEMRRELRENPYTFISSFEGLAVADLSDIRRGLEKVAKRSLVVKHSLIKKVFSELEVEEAAKFLKGNVLLTLGEKDPQDISKVILGFSKDNPKLVLSGIIFEKKVYDENFVKQLATLPSKRELLTQIVVRVQSPISGFVTVLDHLLRGFVVALNEIKKQKESAPQTA